ncbi:uncharacterized protein LOC116255328 isoform X2 [Nymphaea colorata]|nr:uncharacterized protein LOC116255328 isoform X2 [Nymphaea colorata]
MSASPALFTKLTSLPRGVKASHGLTVKPFLAGRCLKRSPLHEVCVRNPVRVNRRHILTGFTPKPVMEWQDCRASVEVDVPCSVAYDFYSDREAFPTWMPMISSVKVLKDKPDLSEWTLAYEFFGRDYSFSWLARNLQSCVVFCSQFPTRKFTGVPLMVFRTEELFGFFQEVHLRAKLSSLFHMKFLKCYLLLRWHLDHLWRVCFSVVWTDLQAK